MILSLDISTSCIGYAIISPDKGDLQKYGYIDLSRMDNRNKFDKARIFEQFIDLLDLDEFLFTDIVIEDKLKSFAFGRTNINTIISLCEMNTIISYCLYQRFDLVPTYINVNAARKLAGIKIVRSDITAKEQTFDFIRNKYNDILFLLYNSKGKIDSKNYDITDSITTGIAFFNSRGPSSNI